jgi:hypothetical protein
MKVNASLRQGFIAVALIFSAMAFAPASLAAPGGGDKSDLNGDGIVDILDLDLFSTNYLELSVTEVDWCAFYQATTSGEDFNGKSTKYYAKNFRMLLSFIYEDFECGVTEPPPPPPPPPTSFEPKYLVRMAQATDGSGDYYITDARTHSLFIYGADLQPKGEIKGLSRPLGVAMDSRGYLLVGNNGRDDVEVYDPANGNLMAVFGDGLVKMPTAITIGPDGSIYVTDSHSHRVWVFDADYLLVSSIGTSGQGPENLDFPVDAALMNYPGGETELFVADQGNARVQVYSPEGEWLRSIYFEGTEGEGCGMMGCDIPGQPPFTRLQALEIDTQGRLHVLDGYAASVNMFDPATGEFIDFYGSYGEDAGTLRVPLDVLVNDAGQAIVNAGDGTRIEVMEVPQ